jgi:2-phosphosulfolactate phosphatase
LVTELAEGVRPAPFSRQHGYAYRFDWGLDGLRALAADADVVVVVDVLRFSTAVCCALESGAIVWPYPWASDEAEQFAAARGALLAGRRELGEPSLSPTDLLHLAPGARLVLPSPNGSTLAFEARQLGAQIVMAASLRNATAVASCARSAAGPDGVVAVVAAGERWGSADGTLRPAVEDLLGAGAVLAALDPSASVSHPGCSPEAAAARAAFGAARPLLYDALSRSASGLELIERGWEDDVATAAALDVTEVVPVLNDDDAFVDAG